MKSTILLLFFTGATLFLSSHQNYIIDDHVDTSSLSVKVEYLNRNKRTSDTTVLEPAAEEEGANAEEDGEAVAGDDAADADSSSSEVVSESGAGEETSDSDESEAEITLDDGSVHVTNDTASDGTGDGASDGTSDGTGDGASDGTSDGTGDGDGSDSAETKDPLNLDDTINDFCDNTNNTCSKDKHKYYEATYIQDQSLWIELSPDSNPIYKSTRHVNLSTSEPKRGYKLQAEDYNLTNFLFYGQPSSDATITILTGGFLHVGDILSPKIVSIAQYIAPFMGNFNPNASESSHVYYYSDENVFIVQWDKMQIANKSDKGNFTFQLQLHKNNDIVFAYKELPEVTLSSEDHENAIGLSDAFHIVSPSHLMIHVYHKLDVNKTKIHSGSAVRLKALTSCTMLTDCYNCTTQVLPEFECRWCSKAQVCSDKHGDSGYAKWFRDCQLNYKEKGQLCEEYCYLPTSTDADEVEHTTYTPHPQEPIIPALNDGSSRLKVECDANYSVSIRYPITASGMFSCTSGGIELPTCRKSCTYTTAPTNGQLKGANVGLHLKPDATFVVTCNSGHKLKKGESRNVTCIDPGVLEPDPANVICERYCTITHPHNAEYNPAPLENGILHEGEIITMTCKEDYAFDAFLRGTQTNNTLTLDCEEPSDFSNLDKMCVGYCKVDQHPNTTYDPSIAMIGQKIKITCANGTFLKPVEMGKEYTCQQRGPLVLPACQAKAEEKVEPSGGSTSHSLTILLIIFILTVVCIVGGWVLYAYRNPTSPSGLFLIEKCRPWTWRSHTYSRHQESLAESYYMDGGI
ncbi:uncharacterized protein LOC134814209 isoform X2 [Bolinopsis microptera]|uniref:uncharacterized protein LOC134814209 isoform X2 n=1 Tax=Bolinopsis microptera TaxID=2820187 RepID=UPI00307A9D79